MMKAILSAVIMLSTLPGNSQTGFGVDVGYATANAVLMNLRYIKNANEVSIGATYEFSKAKGKKVKAQLPGYGLEVAGTGNYFYSIDVGYARMLTDKWHVGAEISFGERTYYTEFKDNRFSGGRYHLSSLEKFVLGFGVNGSYNIDETFSVIAGVHTLRHLSVGLQIRFLK
jgi:hypothetical protein